MDNEEEDRMMTTGMPREKGCEEPPFQHPTLCKLCGGRCCHAHPPMLLHELLFMQAFLGDEAFTRARPTMLREGWYAFREDCPVFEDGKGCRIVRWEDRPTVCQLYPFNPIETARGWVLLLDVAGCQFWQVWGAQHREAENILKSSFLRAKEEEEKRNGIGQAQQP